MMKIAGIQIPLYTKKEWLIAGALFVSYIVLGWLVNYFVPSSAYLHPQYALAIGALFFCGIRLWPVVYVSSLVVNFIGEFPPLFTLVFPLAATLQAVVGAYLLRASGIDPIFRRTRDMGYLILIAAVVSLIAPTLEIALLAIGGVAFTISTWGQYYIATLFSVLVLTPFILRWFSKPRFNRTSKEIIETLGVFTLLLGIDFGLFIADVKTIIGIPLLYVLGVPLFWIALRMRPRFITLALVITATFAIIGILLSGNTLMLTERLFDIEIFIIALAISFFIIVSLEEDRRVNTNIIHSQVDTLKNMLDRARSESRAKNDFIAILAHELRNPLAPVVSGIELLKVRGARDAEESEMLDTMADRMKTVRHLLEDLLDVSRISESKIRLKKERVDLVAAIKDAVLSTEHHRTELHQHFIFNGTRDTLYIKGDAVRIEQIFSNLLTNASKYSHAGDTITLTIRKKERVAEIEVADEGIGLAPHALESIFMPFQQMEEGERSKKGLGIGLALVRSFVEMHEGSVSAMSEGTGKGSRFVVTLPLLPDAPELATTQETVGNQDLSPRTAPLRILIADDNDAAAGGIGRLLELHGCTVTYAYDGRQTIQQALSSSPDVILLDIGLPDQDGYSVAKMVRENGFTGKLIALTGYNLDVTKNRGEEVGFDHYLVKPAGLADLRRVLPEL